MNYGTDLLVERIGDGGAANLVDAINSLARSLADVAKSFKDATAGHHHGKISEKYEWGYLWLDADEDDRGSARNVKIREEEICGWPFLEVVQYSKYSKFDGTMPSRYFIHPRNIFKFEPATQEDVLASAQVTELPD